MISKIPNFDRVKAEKETKILNIEPEEEFIVSQRVANENKTIPEPNESNKKNATSNGKVEIVMDSMTPNKTLAMNTTKISGTPIGMQFLYQADKLACIVKCHTKEHLAEAQKRVSYK